MDSHYRRLWIRFFSYALGLFLLACVRWITNWFGSPTIQQILYHLHYLRQLITQTDSIFFVTFSVECILAPLLLAGAIVASERIASRRVWPASASHSSDPPARAKLLRHLARLLPPLTLAVGVAVFTSRYSVVSYVRSKFGEDRFAQLYVDPANVALQKKDETRNLILIYVESLERTYSDRALFGENLLEALDAIPGSTFDSYVPAPGSGWTIAAMVATQCGIPLQFVTRMDDAETGEHVRSFLPGAVCLPDILHRFGFRNVFLGGARLSYAGKGKFLRTHRYDETYGLIEWLTKRSTLSGFDSWGIFDDDLFSRARQKLVALHDSGVRFNLTLLTLDTHHPEGYYSGTCLSQGPRKFETIVQCVSREVAEFVQFAQNRGYLDDTNIVIIGDHLAMPNPVYAKLLSKPHRTIFNKFVAKTPFQNSTDEIIPFDLFPTLLEYVGIQVDGQRLALGRSGVFRGTRWPKGARPETSPDILNFSQKYEELWTNTLPDMAHE